MPKRGWNLGLLGETGALVVGLFDKRTPLAAKVLAGGMLLYLFSPVDFLPDIIPLMGFADDVAIVPLGLWLAGRLIPKDVMDDARRRFAGKKTRAPVK